MKKLLASAAIVGATIFGATHVAGASAPARNPMPRTWTPTATMVVTTLAENEPAFADYDTTCVVDAIKAEFPNPRTFVRESKKASTSPRITRLSLEVLTTCGGEFTP
jgi:hypothetical protein